MFSRIGTIVALVSGFTIRIVSGHGYVTGVVAGGHQYPGTDPKWIFHHPKPARAGWYAMNQDIGFVGPTLYQTQSITCHKQATPGTTSIPVTAGESIHIQWRPWPEGHHGPVITYLARCDGPCAKVKDEHLRFFAIDKRGMISTAGKRGTWASDQLIKNKSTWTVQIPKGLASGEYVLRHEIIALHTAFKPNGAQNYPNCINLKITGSGHQNPCQSGADCRSGPELYHAKDPGIYYNIYVKLKRYITPGPAVWRGL